MMDDLLILKVIVGYQPQITGIFTDKGIPHIVPGLISSLIVICPVFPPVVGLLNVAFVIS